MTMEQIKYLKHCTFYIKLLPSVYQKMLGVHQATFLYTFSFFQYALNWLVWKSKNWNTWAISQNKYYGTITKLRDDIKYWMIGEGFLHWKKKFYNVKLQ